MDLSRNLLLDAPFTTYQPILECLSPKDQMKPQPYYGRGIKWENQHTEALLIYDAKRKMKAKKRPWPLPWQHVGRVETRLFGKAKCSSVLGMTRLSELCNRYDDMPGVFRAQMIGHRLANSEDAAVAALHLATIPNDRHGHCQRTPTHRRSTC
ncbi:MAG TPA: hypothetical protein VKP65_26075 [Rhodothermales bacterium]|nr:hypothetical protein [Rhodothermales bacterium]